METDYAMGLTAIHVIDQQDFAKDVVKRVMWQITFFDKADTSVSSTALVETYLDTNSLSQDSYTAYDSLTQVMILEWALAAQGGTAFLDQILEGGHKAQLLKVKGDQALTERNFENIPEQ